MRNPPQLESLAVVYAKGCPRDPPVTAQPAFFALSGLRGGATIALLIAFLTSSRFYERYAVLPGKPDSLVTDLSPAVWPGLESSETPAMQPDRGFRGLQPRPPLALFSTSNP